MTDDDQAPLSTRRSRQALWLKMVMVLVPLGLAVDIWLSLWVSYQHVTHSVAVQVETHWQAGERLAARAQLVDHDLAGIDDVAVTSSFTDAAGQTFDLGALSAIEDGGLNQGGFEVPARVAEGSGRLRIHFAGRLPDGEPVALDEELEIRVGGDRKAKTAVHTIAASMLQWADDTSKQPEGLRIDLVPSGRLLAGFENTILVRVTDPKGMPLERAVSVRLVSGEFDGKGGPGEFELGKGKEAPLVFAGRTDALGLASFSGALQSDVVRFEVTLDDPSSPPSEAPSSGPGPAPSEAPSESTSVDSVPTPGAPAPKVDGRKPPQRRFRLVSFSGGVRLFANPTQVRAGETVALEANSLQRDRPIYVDVHDAKGIWIDTLMPPLRAFAPPTPWESPAGLAEGLLHFEAYPYTNAPGESAEVRRVLVVPEAATDSTGGPTVALRPLIEAQRARLDLPREKEGFEPERERAWLKRLEEAEVDAPTRLHALRWLEGSLPVEVYGPPQAMRTRAREDQRLAEWRRSWVVGLRIFLWGGGAFAIALTIVALWRQQSRLVRDTREVLDDPDLSMTMSARGDLLTRGIVVLVILVSALGLTAMMLESLVWKF